MKKIGLLLAAFLLVPGFALSQGPSTELDVEKIRTEPVPLQTSEYADVWVKVTNKGDSTARDAKVSFRPTYPFSVDPDEKTNWSIGDLSPGQQYHIHFEVKVDENAVHGNNSLTFDLSSGSRDVVLTDKVPVEVRTDDAVLSVSGVEFPEKVAPGTSHTMELTLENMADSQLKSIDASLDLSSSDLPFAAANTTTKRISGIEPGETQKVFYTLRTGENAENGLYKIPIDLSYEDESGTSFDSSTMTSVTVGGKPRLEVGVNDQQVRSAGSTGTVTLRIVNRGHGSAEFTQVELQESDDYDIISPAEVYIGGMDADDFQTAEYRLHLNDAENVTLPVELSYRDSTGQVSEVQNVKLRTFSGGELQRYGMAGSGNTMILVVVAVLLLAAGAYYWRKRRE